MKRKRHDVLVLNRSFCPIHIVDWKQAMSVIYQEKVHSLDREFTAYTFDDWVRFSIRNADDYYKIRSINYPIALPEIIVSVTFNRLPDRCVKYSRQNVFTRDKNHCGYCNKQFPTKHLTVDHIFPRAQGGRTTWDNVISSCYSCNQKKADRTPKQAGMKLQFLPSKPEWFSPLQAVTENHPCKTWLHFMKRIET